MATVLEEGVWSGDTLLPFPPLLPATQFFSIILHTSPLALATVFTAVCATQTGRLDILSPGSLPGYLCQATCYTKCL